FEQCKRPQSHSIYQRFLFSTTTYRTLGQSKRINGQYHSKASTRKEQHIIILESQDIRQQHRTDETNRSKNTDRSKSDDRIQFYFSQCGIGYRICQCQCWHIKSYTKRIKCK